MMNGFPHDDSSKSSAPLSSVEQGADERPPLSNFAEEELSGVGRALVLRRAQGMSRQFVITRQLKCRDGLRCMAQRKSIRAIRGPPDLPLNTTTALPRRTLPLSAVRFSVATRIALAQRWCGDRRAHAYVVGPGSPSNRVVEVQSPRESTARPRADTGLVTSTEVRIEPKVETAITPPPLGDGNENGASAVSAPPNAAIQFDCPECTTFTRTSLRGRMTNSPSSPENGP